MKTIKFRYRVYEIINANGESRFIAKYRVLLLGLVPIWRVAKVTRIAYWAASSYFPELDSMDCAIVFCEQHAHKRRAMIEEIVFIREIET